MQKEVIESWRSLRNDYPPLYRVVQGTCARCGRESAHCAKVAVVVKGRGKSPRYGRAMMTCATCRELHVMQWRVAPGWHDGIAITMDGDGMTAEEFAAWCRVNEPVEVDE